jgi:hypothetical protein
MPRLPFNTGAIASPFEGKRSTGSEPEPIWLCIDSSVTLKRGANAAANAGRSTDAVAATASSLRVSQRKVGN